MTTKSANGWPVITDHARTRLIHIPGSQVVLRVADDDDVATILTAIAWWIDRTVEDIDTREGVKGHDVPDDWGWAVRKIRGALRAISNHASGTAIDINAVAHPMAVHNTWSTAERSSIDAFLAKLGAGVVRWGEHYKSRVDGMHFEINTTDRAAIGRAAAAARALMAPPHPTPAPHPAPKVVIRRVVTLRRLRYMRGDDVRAIQRLIGTKVDGVWGRGSDRALRAWQRAKHLTVDGQFGPACTRAANWAWAG